MGPMNFGAKDGNDLGGNLDAKGPARLSDYLLSRKTSIGPVSVTSQVVVNDQVLATANSNVQDDDFVDSMADLLTLDGQLKWRKKVDGILGTNFLD